MLTFDGRVAIVTGAGGGLGRAHALVLASRGARVVVNDLGGAVDGSGGSAGPAEQVADEIRALGGEAVADTNSVADPDSAGRIVGDTLQRWGRVDIVINNAGVLRDRALHNVAPDTLDPVLDVHLRGAFFVLVPAVRAMRAQGHGRVLNTTSSAGLFGNFGQSAYGAAKMGLVGLTRVLALEGAKYGIKANAIAPTAMTRMTEGILGEDGARLAPDLVAPLAAWLVHDDCPVTGEVYSVGGGRIARVFVAETAGWQEAAPTPESVRDAFDDIRDTSRFTIPQQAGDDIELVLRASLAGQS